MRRYNIVSGILLILSTINFTLAVPILAQEQRQARVDMVHIPKDAVTVLGKRVGDPLDLMWENYFQKLWGKPEESVMHASSSSAPLGADHGSTNVIQDSASNPASSTANPDHALVEPTSQSPAVSQVHEAEGGTEHAVTDDRLHGPLFTPASSEIVQETEAHTPHPNPNPASDSEFDWNYWMNYKDSLKPPSTKSGVNWKYWMNPLNLMSPLTPEATKAKLAMSKPSSTKSGVSWKYRMNPLTPGAMKAKPASSKISNPEPSSTKLGASSSPEYWLEPTSPASSKSLNSGPLKIREPKIDHQSSSADPPAADSQPIDFQAAIIAAKGNAKESRRVSSTARDVENMAQREFQPVEGSLAPVQRRGVLAIFE